MRLLLDTHSFLWFIAGSPQISTSARALIEDASNQPLLSVASLWEMAIKMSLGKLSLGQPFETLIGSITRFLRDSVGPSKVLFNGHQDRHSRLGVCKCRGSER